MPVLGSEKPSEGDLVDAWVRHSEDAGGRVHAGVCHAGDQGGGG